MQAQILRALSIQELHGYESHPKSIDVIISVGGFYGFYMIGVDKILKKLENQQRLKINRYAGSSVGSICSILMACNVHATQAIKIYNNLLNQKNFFKYLKRELLSLLPEDAYLTCTDKVFIHATRVHYFGFRHEVFSKFSSNEELIDAALASSNMPFIISPFLFYRFKNNYYLDGCFTNILPYFIDNVSEQLLIKLYKIKYYHRFSFLPEDPSIEALIVKGLIETDKFLSNYAHHCVDTLEWYNAKKIKKKNIHGWVFLISIGISSFYLWRQFRNRKK